MSTPPFLALPDGVHQRTVQTARGDFAALDNAAALTESPRGAALLIPGFTGSKEDYIAVLEPLAAHRIRALAYDQRGQYETVGPQDPAEYSLGSFAADALEISHQLPQPCALAGHSFGGLVVREAALTAPNAVAGIALIGSGPSAIPDEQQPLLRHFVQIMNDHGLEAVWEGKRALEAEAGVAIPAPDIDEFLRKRFLANTPASLEAMIGLLCSEPDRVAELAPRCPRGVVIVGGRDDVWSPQQQREMAKILVVEVVEIPDAGHSPAVDAPEATVEALLRLYDD